MQEPSQRTSRTVRWNQNDRRKNRESETNHTGTHTQQSGRGTKENESTRRRSGTRVSNMPSSNAQDQSERARPTTGWCAAPRTDRSEHVGIRDHGRDIG